MSYLSILDTSIRLILADLTARLGVGEPLDQARWQRGHRPAPGFRAYAV